jgi:photosystem II stability/assembly factor-like uncharacterized protein
MSPWKWIVGGVAVVVLVVVGVVAMTASAPTSSPARSFRSDVVDITEHGRPLRGEPMDLVAVGSHYVGFVQTTSGNRFATSDDGRDWETVEPEGLPAGDIQTSTYPGGLNYVQHLLFSDGETVFLRIAHRAGVSNLGTVELYSANADARTWHRVTLPAPAGQAAFPIAALTANGKRYIAGSVYEQNYGRGYLDAAVWVSDGGDAWRRIDAPAFASAGNQTILALGVAGNALLAGGGDGALLDNTECCYFPYGAAFWRSTDGGEHWSRSKTNATKYKSRELATVIGFVRGGAVVQADVAAYPSPRTAATRDLGRTWTMATHPTTKSNRFPRASAVLRRGGAFVATTTPGDSCTDCTDGAVSFSRDGVHWRDVTPTFPCRAEGRSNYGFVSRPVAVGSSVVALGGCGGSPAAFSQTLLGISGDNGAHWRIARFAQETGDPLPAVAGNERIVTLVRSGRSDSERDRMRGQVRAVVVYP